MCAQLNELIKGPCAPNVLFYKLHIRCEFVKTDSELIRASYTRCGGENGLSESLPVSCTYGVVKTNSPIFYRLHTCCEILKPNSPNICKPPTRFAVIKTESPNVYQFHTHFAVVKMDSPSFYKSHICIEVVKTNFSKLLQASYALCDIVKMDTLNLFKLLHALQ